MACRALLLLIIGLLATPALPTAACAKDAWARLEVGGGLLTGLSLRPRGDTELMYGPAITVDAVGALIDPKADAHFIFGATWGIAPAPNIGGHPLGGDLSWGGPGAGMRWLLDEARWTVEGALYIVDAEARLTDRPDVDTGLAALLRARVGRRWRMPGGALSVAGALLWFRATDDDDDTFTVHHAVLSLTVGWSIGGDGR